MLFYILSLKYSEQGHVVWWRDECRGYTDRLKLAGKYAEATIAAEPAYFNNGRTTRAVACEALDGPIPDELLNHLPLEVVSRLYLLGDPPRPPVPLTEGAKNQ